MKASRVKKDPWEAKARDLIKAAIVRKNLSYEDLVKRLATIGVNESSANLNNKINRGQFPLALALQILHVLGAKRLELDT